MAFAGLSGLRKAPSQPATPESTAGATGNDEASPIVIARSLAPSMQDEVPFFFPEI